jgi:hypothetical protein
LLRQKTFQNELGELLQVEFEALTDSLHAPICQMAAAKIEGQLDSTFILVEQANSVKPNSPASASLPLEFALRQNYPNPFNAGTTIAFQLPWSAAVNIRILNSLGEVVAVLADKSFDAGKHEVSWSGKNHAREEVASGVYFCEIHAGSFVQRHKMLLLR